MTLTEARDTLYYLATLETDVTPGGVNLQTYEEGLFLNLATTRDATLTAANHTAEQGITNNETARLNGNDAGRRIGPAKLLAVSPGDHVSIEAYAYHTGGYSNSGDIGQSNLVTALSTAFGGSSNAAIGTEARSIYELFNANAAVAFGGSAGNSSQPKAYLNYLLFDQDFNYLDAGFVQTNNTANTHQQLTLSKSITQGGYIYVYLSNESQTDFNVYFDDLRITHVKGAILQENHYYPFGLGINPLSSNAPLSKPNQFKYNGFEEQTDFDLGWYDYQARYYDPQLGRFTQLDPAADLMRRHSPYNYAFDNPIRFIDPDGMMPTEATDGEESTGEVNGGCGGPDEPPCEETKPSGEEAAAAVATEVLQIKHAIWNQILKGVSIKPINKRATFVQNEDGTWSTGFVDVKPQTSIWGQLKEELNDGATLLALLGGGPSGILAKNGASSSVDDILKAMESGLKSSTSKNLSPDELKKLVPTEPGAQSDDYINAIKQTIESNDVNGMMDLLADPIYTTTVNGVGHILDGHNRVKAFSEMSMSLRVIELSPAKAVEMFKSKMQDIISN